MLWWQHKDLGNCGSALNTIITDCAGGTPAGHQIEGYELVVSPAGRWLTQVYGPYETHVHVHWGVAGRGTKHLVAQYTRKSQEVDP